MKKLLLVFLIIFSTFSLGFSDQAIKPQRLDNDPKIIAYGLVKSPNIFYPKLLKFADSIYPGIGEMIEQQVAPVKTILNSATSIGFVVYANETFQQDPVIGIFIEAKEKSVFDNPVLGQLPEKELVDNTMIISFVPGYLAKFKILQKSINSIKSQNDIEVYIDFKNITKLNEASIISDMPGSLDIFYQFEMLAITMNILDLGIESSACLIATEKSNLQKMLNQKGLEAPSQLELLGDGNFSYSFSSIDLTKCKGFIQDIFKMAIQLPKMSDVDKKHLQSLESILLDFCSNELITCASIFSFSTEIQSKMAFKLKEPNKFIQNLKLLTKELNEVDLNGGKNNLDKNVSNNYSWTEAQNINKFQVYKLSNLKNDKKYEPDPRSTLFEVMINYSYLPKEYYLLANSEYCFVASSFESLKEIIDNLDSKSKQKIKCESFNYFKNGYSIYADTYFDGYIKLFESILKIKLEKLLNLNLPPFKTAIKLDGNLTVKTFIEKETIAKIILKIQELYAK